MRKVRYLGFVVGFLLLVAPAAVTGAVSGEGIQLGPTLFYPALSVKATHDDNFYLVSHNPESGWVTTISPYLRLELPVHRYYLDLEGGLDFLNYYDIEQDNTTNWFVGGSAGADFPGGLSFKITDKHAERYLLGSQEFGAGENSTVNTLNATVAYAVRNALRLELFGKREASTFDHSLRRERVETTVQADLYWKFRPTISGLFEGSYAVYEYDSNTPQNNDATQVALGLSWDLTARSTGVAKAGYQWKRYDVQNRALGTEDGSYYTFLAGLKHSFSQRTVLRVDLSRSSQESDFPENPYFLMTLVDASLSQGLTVNIYGRVGVRYSLEKYPNTTSYVNPYDTVSGTHTGERSDTTFGASAACGFNATRWLSFELEYGIARRNSNFDTFDYDVTRLTLSAKAKF